MEGLRQGEREKGSEGRSRTTREHSVHFSDEVEGEQREEVATDVVDTPRMKVEGKGVEKEEEEEVERLRVQMQQRERRDSMELVKEVTIHII